MALNLSCLNNSWKLCRFAVNLHGMNYSQAIDKTFNIFDQLTTQLIEKQICKWEYKRTNNCKPIKLPHIAIHSSLTEKSSIYQRIDNLNEKELTFLLQNTLNENDYSKMTDLTEQCIKLKKCPTVPLLLFILSYFSQNGNIEIIKHIESICERKIVEKNSNFEHFIAEATWIKGNITKSLELFENVYKTNSFLRREIRLMLKYLIMNYLTNKSEAVLVNIINFSERLVNDYNDNYPLTYIWQTCFLSEWYSDQCKSLELLEKNIDLCESLTYKIPYVVYTALNYHHRTEIVYRLLELLLKYDMKRQYSSVLVTLLDYQFKVGDLKRCSEIIQWSIDNEVDLPDTHCIKLINLLLNKTMQTPFAKLKSLSTFKKDNIYELKF